jgi:hypothetical protein
LKRRLAAQHAGDREAYTDAKAEFVADALRRAAAPGAHRRLYGEGIAGATQGPALPNPRALRS